MLFAHGKVKIKSADIGIAVAETVFAVIPYENGNDVPAFLEVFQFHIVNIRVLGVGTTFELSLEYLEFAIYIEPILTVGGYAQSVVAYVPANVKGFSKTNPLTHFGSLGRCDYVRRFHSGKGKAHKHGYQKKDTLHKNVVLMILYRKFKNKLRITAYIRIQYLTAWRISDISHFFPGTV